MECTSASRMVGIAVTAMMGAGVVPGALEGQATLGGDWRADVRSFAEHIIDAGLAPGLGVAVAAGDWVVFDEAFGSADRATDRPARRSTPFYIASTTKSLTALAAILLAHRGELDLDAPIEQYVTDARLPEGVGPGAIRVRDLITLTHGLSEGGPIVFRTAFTGEVDPTTIPNLLHSHPPTGNAGDFRYGNLGFNLLGLVLERVTGMGWQEVVEEEVLQPVGMEHTTAFLSSLAPDRPALPHQTDPQGGFVRIELQKTDANLHAAGGHFATAGDLARYLAMHLSDGRVDGVPILPVEPVQWTREVQVAQDARFGPFHRHGWGFGWDIGTYGDDLLVHRFGSFQGYRSHVSFMPDRGVGVVVLTNGDGVASPAVDLLATYIYDRLAGRPEVERIHAERLSALMVDAEGGRGAVAAELARRAERLRPLRHPPAAYVGRYENPLLGAIEFREVAGGLEYRMGAARGRAEIFDADREMLRIVVGSGTVVEFHFAPGGGPASALTLQGLEFSRVER